MRFKLFLRSTLAFLGLAGISSGMVIDYDANITPNDPSMGSTFTAQVFTGTRWEALNGELTLYTAYAQGIWFGHDNFISIPYWAISDYDIGNKINIRAKVQGNDWSFYLRDGSYAATFRFFSDHFTCSFPGGTQTNYTNMDSYHDYEIFLKDGLVTYSVDQSVLYSGRASSSSTKVLVIGDGSGPTIGGNGTMTIDHVTVDTEPSYQPGASLFNGDAETGLLLPWTASNVAVVQQQNQSSGTVTPYQGSRFFSMATAPGSSCSMWQTNALPDGITRLTLSGYVQTENLADDDYGTAILSALNSSGEIIASVTNSPLTTALFNWVPFSVDLWIPDGTAAWKVELRGTLQYGSYVNVFYDALTLQDSSPSIQIGNVSTDTSSRMALTWSSSDSNLSYTVEGTTNLLNTPFAPVAPTNQWPTSATTWTSQPLLDNQGYFRVRVTPP